MTISKEEREEWREDLAEFEVIANIISDNDDNWIRRAVRALDALEDAERERDLLAQALVNEGADYPGRKS